MAASVGSSPTFRSIVTRYDRARSECMRMVYSRQTGEKLRRGSQVELVIYALHQMMAGSARQSRGD